MALTIFQANTKAKSAEVNANFNFIASDRLIGFDSSDGSALSEFDLGDLTEITGGSLVGDWLARSGKSLKVYNASGVLQGSVSYDDLLNLQTATTTQEGTGEIATDAEVAAATETGAFFLNPANLASLFTTGQLANNGHFTVPVIIGGAFQKAVVQWGTRSVDGSAVVTLPTPYDTAQLFNIASQKTGVTATKYYSTDVGSTTQFTIYASSIGSANATWLSIGY